MYTLNANKELVKLRDLSSVFSRSAFVDILNYCDYSHFDWLVNQYSSSLNCTTYFDLIKKTYSIISKHYRCEKEGCLLGDNWRTKGHFEGVGFRLAMDYTSQTVKTNFTATFNSTGK